MTNNDDIFISHKLKNPLTANRWFCSNVVLALLTFLTHDNVQTSSHCTRLIKKFFGFSFGVPLVLLWLSYRPLKWIRSVFEEGSKVMRISTLLTNIYTLQSIVLEDSDIGKTA